jgi:leader peptidase (prepilin peptidase)/N-methyltransferase
MDPFVAVFLFALGAVIGSFLNVVIHRLPRRESVVFPPSRCPSCGAGIRPRDNVPVLSYLLLRGRCRSCSVRIPLRYPVVELLAALAAVAMYHRFGLTLPLVLFLPFSWSLVVLAFIDAEHQILPDRITLPGIALSAAVPAAGLLGERWARAAEPISFGEWAFGILLGAAIPFGVGEAYRLSQFRKPPGERVDGMGMGDVKMLAMVGGFLGWKLVLLTILLGSLLGSAWGLAGVALARYRMKQALPFGTFLAVGAFLSLVAGPALVRWYARISGLGG